MFYSLKKITTLLIDADDFYSQRELLARIIRVVAPVLTVKLISRYHDYPHPYLDRTIVPKTIYEHIDFELQLKRTIESSPPQSVVYLCNSIDSLEQARSLICGTVFFANRTLTPSEKHLLYMESPDFVVNSFDSLMKCLTTLDLGFNAEVALAKNFARTTTLCQSLSECDTASSQKSTEVLKPEVQTRLVKLPNPEYPDCAYWAQGRYFGRSDPRHDCHELSKSLWTFKRHHRYNAGAFAQLFLDGIETAQTYEATKTTGGTSNRCLFDCVTQVPGRFEIGDRLKHCLSILSDMLEQPPTHAEGPMPSIHPAQIMPDVLRCVKNHGTLKTLGLKARKAAIVGSFTVQQNVQGKNVVVIDDIVTTGATMNECIRVLRAAGAATVTPVLLAYHPFSIKSGRK